MKKLKRIYLAIVFFSLLTSFSMYPALSAPIWIPNHVTAEINDMWLDGDRCIMDITITNVSIDSFYFEYDQFNDIIVYNVGEEVRVYVLFYNNETNERLYGNGSNGYKIGDEIEGDLEFFGDEWSSSDTLYTYSIGDQNYAISKWVKPSYIISYLAIAIIVSIPIIWLLKKRKDHPK